MNLREISLVGAASAILGAGAAYGVMTTTVTGNKERIRDHEALPIHPGADARLARIEEQIVAIARDLDRVENHTEQIASRQLEIISRLP